MTQNNTKRRKVILPVSIATIFLVGVAGFTLFTPYAQAIDHLVVGDPWTGVPLGPIQHCVDVSHFDKIIFQNEDEFLNSDGTIAVEKETIMDIKVPDDPTKVEFPMLKVLEKVNAEWTNKDGEVITLEDVELIDIEYAIVCVSYIEAEVPPGWTMPNGIPPPIVW